MRRKAHRLIVKTHTYAEFWSRGTDIPSQKVKSKKIEDLEIPKDVWAFQHFKIRAYMRDGVIDAWSQRFEQSPVYILAEAKNIRFRKNIRQKMDLERLNRHSNALGLVKTHCGNVEILYPNTKLQKTIILDPKTLKQVYPIVMAKLPNPGGALSISLPGI